MIDEFQPKEKFDSITGLFASIPTPPFPLAFIPAGIAYFAAKKAKLLSSLKDHKLLNYIYLWRKSK
jgi:hypothetical protein